MMGYKLGDKVRVIDVVNIDGVQGTFGEILGVTITGKWRVKVYFPGTQSDNFTLTEDQVQPAYYTWNGGAIGWDDGFAAIKQLVEDCTGSKDVHYLQETLDTIYLIATEEIDKRVTAGEVRGG